jgi:hypothetical protein
MHRFQDFDLKGHRSDSGFKLDNRIQRYWHETPSQGWLEGDWAWQVFWIINMYYLAAEKFDSASLNILEWTLEGSRGLDVVINGYISAARMVLRNFNDPKYWLIELTWTEYQSKRSESFVENLGLLGFDSMHYDTLRTNMASVDSLYFR